MEKIICLIICYVLLRIYHATRTKAYLKRTDGLPYEIEIVAENLNIPWAMDISEQNALYFTQRPGTVRVIKNGQLIQEPLITFSSPFVSEGEGGLLGLALDPDFISNRYIYVLHTYKENNQYYNRVVRLHEYNNRATVDKVILDKIPASLNHNGGRIKIGPDKKLYITVGDADQPELAQDINSLAGKILRIELDGSIPQDNPIPNSPVYSLGHRNPQGITWDQNNNMYITEHGPIAHDEINKIQPGGNYGWPLVAGKQEASLIQTIKPLLDSGDETFAPSGITFINEGPLQGRLLVATLRGKQLLSILPDEEGVEVLEIDSFLNNEFGRLRDVILASDGSIYIATSNRDGRGIPDRTDDKIIRLVPLNNLSLDQTSL